MNLSKLTKRTFQIKRTREGTDHRIKEILIHEGQLISPGDDVCIIHYEKPSRDTDGSQVISKHTSTLSFDTDKYGTVQALDITARIGHKLSESPVGLFTYEVENNFSNLIETTLIDLTANAKKLYHSTSIPKSKLQNAIDKYASGVDESRVHFLYDNTLFGSAKDGFLITDSALYCHNVGTRYELRFNDINSWDHTETLVQKSKEEVLVRHLEVHQRESSLRIPHSTGMLDWSRLDALLDIVQAISREGKTRDVDGLIIIQDMTDEIKSLYVQAIIWMVYDDDQKIDPKELAELQLLMTQLRFSSDMRYHTRSSLADSDTLILDEIIDSLMKQVPTGSEKPIAISLVKDMIRVFQSANNTDASNSPQITQTCKLLEVDDDQMQLIATSIEFDRKVLDGSLDSSEMRKAAESLAAKAAAVGIPIAAVYLSGSVAGLSAAGIASGLGALGLGGVLGLSSMVTGIGMVILLGVGVYKGVQWMVSGNEEEQRERFRELMLQEVIRNHQKTIAVLGEDLANFAKRVVDLTRNVLENELRIEKLRVEVSLFADALEALQERESKYEDALEAEIEKRTAK